MKKLLVALAALGAAIGGVLAWRRRDHWFPQRMGEAFGERIAPSRIERLKRRIGDVFRR